MARRIKQKVLISEIFFDEDLYPRNLYNWQTGYDYSQSMKTGSKFPDIILAIYNNKKYLVDGKHRIEAYKLLKIKEVDAIIHVGWNRKKIYTQAVKANISHGRVLSPYEKRMIAMKLLEFEYKNSEISKIIQVPLDKLERFVTQRSVNVLTGVSTEDSASSAQKIAKMIVKSGAGHYSGTTLDLKQASNIESVQRNWNMHSQVDLLKQVIDLIENNFLDLQNSKVLEKFNYLRNLIIKGG